MRSRRHAATRRLLFTALAVGLTGLYGSALAAEDHTGHFDGPLNTGPEVTQACLECHEDAADQVMATSHWTWSSMQTIGGKQVNRGKLNAINNF